MQHDWIYYGIWKCPEALQALDRPLTALVLQGQVVFEESSSEWHVQFANSQTSALLYLGNQEKQFLEDCRAAGLSCWASGPTTGPISSNARYAHGTRQYSLMVPDDFQVYNTPDTEMQGMPPKLAKSLVINRQETDFLSAWNALNSSLSRRLHHIHPGAIEHITRATETPLGLAARSALVFTAHCEAGTVTGTSLAKLSPWSALGTSNVYYHHRRQRCAVHTRCTKPPLFKTLRGACIVCDDAAMCVEIATELATRLTLPLRRSLILVPRAALAQVEASFEAREIGSDTPPAYALHSQAELETFIYRHPETSGAAVVIMPQHLAIKCWAFVTRINVDRLIMLGLPHPLIQRMSPLGRSTVCLLLREATHIVMHPEAAASKLCSLESVPVSRAMPALAWVLGVSNHLGIGDQDLAPLLQDRLLYLERDPNGAPTTTILHCHTETLPCSNALSIHDAPTATARKTACLGMLSTSGRRSLTILKNHLSIPDFFGVRRPPSEYTDQSFGKSGDAIQCSICLDEDPAEAKCVTICGHWYCTECILTVIRQSREVSCPTCRQVLKPRLDVVVPAEQETMTPFLKSLADELRERNAQKVIVALPYGDCHERISHALRKHETLCLSWSGCAKRLSQQRRAFQEAAEAVLLCDPAFFSVHWLQLRDVEEIWVVDAQAIDMKLCCLLKTLKRAAPSAKTIRLYGIAGASSEERIRTDYGCHPSSRCPLLVRANQIATSVFTD